MSRISKYQEHIREFLKNKSFIKNTRESTRQIITEMADETDHFLGILCLTIINHRCKQDGIKMHGYHLASGIEALGMVVKVMGARDYYDNRFTVERVSNMIMDVTNWFYNCLAENITTLRLSNEDKVDGKSVTNITTKCINYAAKHISKITEQKIYDQYFKMKKSDIFCIDFDKVSVDNYRQMRRLDLSTMVQNIHSTYGMMCRLAICLGWLIGMGDDQKLAELESLADSFGMLMKIQDDFKNHRRDMRYGSVCANVVVTHGIKEALILYDEAHLQYLEQSSIVGVETKTCNEIVKCIVDYVTECTADMSIDIDTDYDDITSHASHISHTSYASHASRTSKGIASTASHGSKSKANKTKTKARQSKQDSDDMECAIDRHRVIIE